MVCHRSQPEVWPCLLRRELLESQARRVGGQRGARCFAPAHCCWGQTGQLLVTNWKNSTKIHCWHDSNLNRNTAVFSIIVGCWECARKQSDCLYFLCWSALGASQETFDTLRAVIDFLSPGVISTWMSCCVARARNIRDQFCHRDLEGADQTQLTGRDRSQSLMYRCLVFPFSTIIACVFQIINYLIREIQQIMHPEANCSPTLKISQLVFVAKWNQGLVSSYWMCQVAG